VSVANDIALFSRLLREEKTRRGMTWKTMSEGTGLSAAHLKRLAAGQGLASTESAERLAEFFVIPAFNNLIARIRTKKCIRCGVTFRTSSHGNKQVYCNGRCENRAQYEKARGVQQRALITELHDLRELTDRQSMAIAAFCASCEPGGRCHDASCHIQEAGISPLPLSRCIQRNSRSEKG